MTMSMPTMNATASHVASSAATAAASAMGSMDMGGRTGCRTSKMVWNWNTIDSCFLSSHWRITSDAMFAGSCIGVILLVIFLEFLRRAGKDYDAYILRDHQRKFAVSSSAVSARSVATDGGMNKRHEMFFPKGLLKGSGSPTVFRPTLPQQMIRAALHMMAFAVAYMVMLLAMYYNGYIILCIFIGAYLGFFIFGWESTELGSSGGPAEDATGSCCG